MTSPTNLEDALALVTEAQDALAAARQVYDAAYGAFVTASDRVREAKARLDAARDACG